MTIGAVLRNMVDWEIVFLTEGINMANVMIDSWVLTGFMQYKFEELGL